MAASAPRSTIQFKTACPVRFSVVTADETETFYDGTFNVGDGGVLMISPEDETEHLISLSPAF